MIHTTFHDALYKAFLQKSPEACAYFGTWTYDVPLAIRPETHVWMGRIQKLYLTCIRHLVEHYLERYQSLMPLPERVIDLLKICQGRPYRPGTYRTDFVIGMDNSIHLIETTCRFAMNGFFQAGIFAQLAEAYVRSHPDIRWVDPHQPFFKDFAEYFGSVERVCVLLGCGSSQNESKTFLPIFEASGIRVEKILAADIPASTHLLENAAVIGELSHEEWCALPMETVETLVGSNLMNDLRTVLLVHDKRFFALLHRDEFMSNALTPEERAEFMPFLVPTYTRGLNPEIWPEARRNKDRWIIKPHNNGKSIDVFAGPCTGEGEWEAMFDSGRADNMVLQAYIPQRTFRGTIAGVPREDYVAGTLLFFEDGFYGTGLFRASSHPVTNQGENRKIAPLVTSDYERFDRGNVL